MVIFKYLPNFKKIFARNFPRGAGAIRLDDLHRRSGLRRLQGPNPVRHRVQSLPDDCSRKRFTDETSLHYILHFYLHFMIKQLLERHGLFERLFWPSNVPSLSTSSVPLRAKKICGNIIGASCTLTRCLVR